MRPSTGVLLLVLLYEVLMVRQVNAATVSLLDTSEACHLTAYRDPSGILTIGWGETGPQVKLGMTITQAAADAWRNQKIAVTAAFVEKRVRVTLTNNQFGALVDFAYNSGVGAFAGSTLLRKLNAGNFAAVPDQLKRWVKDENGTVLGGLVTRRNKEIALWSTPDDHPNPIGVIAAVEPASEPLPPKVKASPPSFIEQILAWFHRNAPIPTPAPA